MSSGMSLVCLGSIFSEDYLEMLDEENVFFLAYLGW